MTRPEALAHAAGLGGTLALAGWAALGQAAEGAGGVAFSAAELAVVGSLLMATTGALSMVFRLLLGAKDEQIRLLGARVVALEQAREADRNELLTLLQGTIEATRTAAEHMSDALTQLTASNQARLERATTEHLAMQGSLERLAVLLMGGAVMHQRQERE